MIDGGALGGYLVELVRRAARARVREPLYPRIVAELALRLTPAEVAQAVAAAEIAAGLVAPGDRLRHIEVLTRLFWTTPIDSGAGP